MKSVITTLMLAAAFGLGCAVAARAESCDHKLPIEMYAESLKCQADELQDVFRDQFCRSSCYGELRRTAARLERNARVIRNQSDWRKGVCRVTDEINESSSLICELETLVNSARLRALQGLDRPLTGCTMHVDARLARMRQTLLMIRAEATAMTVSYRPEIATPPYVSPPVYVTPQAPRSGQPTPAIRFPAQTDPGFAPDYLPGASLQSPYGRQGSGAYRDFSTAGRDGLSVNGNTLTFRIGNMSFAVNR
jgi:hypothetical protein